MMTPLTVPKEFFQRPEAQLSDAEKMQKRHEADGTLRMTITEDETGRKIRRFFGSPGAVWDQFKQPSRRLTGIGRK
jgi:hypothetical protein